ncbi:hypothetical protein [Clostridium intestinale]|uniref:Uncharacterized protein n=1 Tax=Clostridium intestinale TaxID=36845 RepID=A0A7D6VRE9_9CLOT|nr:hypothetical protein [Clostridium intestinale]QLY79177.1 hypothetical protein HZF06_19170 [Clostridium intestinale]
MYNVTQTFLDKIKSRTNRVFDSSVTIRDVTFTEDDIINISLSEDVNPADSFMLGSVASNVLEIEIMNVPESLILDGAKVTAKIGVNTGSTFEYVPLGVFWIDEIKKDSYSVKLTCVDNMIKLEKAYFSNLSYPISINSVAQEICSKVGIELATSLPSTQVNKIEGYTYREAISFIASFLGGFARFNRLGKLEIVSYTTTNIRIENQFSFTTNEKPFTIGRISCQVEENILTTGSIGNEIQLENPIMTQTQLNNIYNTLKTLNYMPYDMEYEGNLALMAGDKITIVGPDDVVYSTLLMRQKLSYEGGLNATASAVGKTEQGQEFNSGGSIKTKVDRVVIEQANIKILLAEKATIENLTVVKLKAEQAVIDIGSINTLLAGNITAANIKAGTITAGSGIIANEAIGDAQIANLKVGKLLAGDLSTNKFKIVSDSGNMLISDNTIQIKDSTRVRVQIGKDASNDYNMYVWDSTGNLMFDAAGLKASGIKSKIIRDDMVSDTANISGNKIEKESLVSQINGATTTLKASKIKFDDINQTLDIAFNSLKSTVNETGQTVSSQGTAIGTLQGQISTKIWQTDITTAINNISIGVRNIVRNSTFNFGKKYWDTMAGYWTILPPEADKPESSIAYAQYTGYAQNSPLYNYAPGTPVKADGTEKVTISLDIFSTDINLIPATILTLRLFPTPDSAAYVTVVGNFGRSQVTNYTNGTWARRSFTLTIPSSAAKYLKAGLYQSAGDVNFKIREIKVEMGTKATDWTPAPEDVDTKINDNYSSINQTINGINTTVGSMQTSISGHETRISTAEGSINTFKDQILLKVEKTDIYNIAGLVTKIDDRDASLIYTGTWLRGNDPAHYNTTYSHNATANTSVKLTFEGVGIRWITSKNTFRGYADVKIDGTIVATNVDTYSATTVSNFVAFEKLGLTYGQHTIEIIVKGTKRAEAASAAVLIDCFEVLKEAQTQIDSTVSSLSLLSNQITSKVSTTDFETYKTQTANQISSKVNALDFGSLIEQNPSNVRIAVGQIGGTNLIPNSRGDLGSYSWSGAVDGYYNGITVRDCGGGVIRLLNGTTSEQFSYNGNGIVVKPNTKYTLSGKYWVGANSKGIDIYALGTKAPQTPIAFTYIHYALADRSVTVDSFKSFSYTFTTNSDEYNLTIRVDNEGMIASTVADVYFMLKLEEGENATAWSPHSHELKSSSFEVNDSYARFTGQDGSYTEFAPNTTGLKWHKVLGDTGRDYHYLSYSDTATMTMDNDLIITLPSEFKNKDLSISVGVKDAVAASSLSFFWALGGFGIVENKANGTIRLHARCATTRIDLQGNFIGSNTSNPITINYTVTA